MSPKDSSNSQNHSQEPQGGNENKPKKNPVLVISLITCIIIATAIVSSIITAGIIKQSSTVGGNSSTTPSPSETTSPSASKTTSLPPSETVSPSPSQTTSASPSAAQSPSPSATPSASESPLPSASPLVSQSLSPSASPLASQSPSPSASPSPSPSASPSASPSPSSSSSFEYVAPEGFTIQLLGCSQRDETVRCNLKVTSTKSDSRFSIYGTDYYVSRIIDTSGNEYMANLAELASNRGSFDARSNLIKNTPVNAAVFFQRIRSKINQIAVLEVSCKAEDQPLKARFFKIPVTE